MKAVIVIDMPVDCPECPMAHWNKLDEFTGCDAVSGKKYAINDKEYAESSCRPLWCPLRPLPSFKAVDLNDTRDVIMFCHGWNTSLAEITGETE